ncbi:nitrate- and nitrite sensing domain-containing protein [Streptomyces sp. NPDC052109]|uniref:sensor histidine kinase n=1 Tax=Streptomyces sp. NPDC052109 TaxID=3155527 RepID=UPI0034316858
MRWPLGRPTTVRARIVALALAPAVALMGLWSFAMWSVTGELRALIRVQGVYEDFGTPVDTAIGQIQIERRLSAAYLGARLDTATAGQLLEQQRRTDRAVDAMRQAVRDGDRGRLTARQRQALDAVVAATGRLDGLRSQVLSRRITWDRAVDAYSTLVEPGFDVQSTLTALQAGQMAREAQVVIELVRVREFVSREDALVAGARAAGTLTDRQYDSLTATIEDRRVFQRTYVPDLPADSRALFEDFQRGGLYGSLVRGEDALLRAGAAGAGKAVAADTWRSTTDRAVVRYRELCTTAAENSAVRGRAFAYRELTKAAVVGVVGLAAAGLSLWFAVRGARRVSRRLETLRDAADVLATDQLPDVMRRLSAGEEVDALAEAPPLAADEVRDDEIGQVGRSFNTARLAAVEAAVRQATLRRGLFAVLLNIARRNQALVHRQLKLVDTLERRTDDPDVLRELFRIDHLTTRMRRHAESLIILSGAAPGRRWRKPVPVADVVASAVGEIEDYARVVVPQMPEAGVAADAVADVVHLIAELLENATVFSPPHTQVTLRTGRVGSGFVLEIDDRGIGLDTEARTRAHGTLTDPDAFDPTRHDRLGLYVVGRLAARHGIEVTLRDSPYGGTTAVVLLPQGVLAEVEPPASESREQACVAGQSPPRGSSAAPREAGSGAVEDLPRRNRLASVPAPGSQTPAGEGQAPPPAPDPGSAPDQPAGTRPLPPPSPASPRSEQPPSPRASRGVASELPSAQHPTPSAGLGAGAVSESPAEEPVPSSAAPGPGTRTASPWAERPTSWAGTGARAAESPADGRQPSCSTPGPETAGDSPTPPPALPTRVRQASLVPELREEPPARDRAAKAPEADADEMRAIFGAFQRGLDRGRKGLPAPGEAATEAPTAMPTEAPTETATRSTGAAQPTAPQLPGGERNGATGPHTPAPDPTPAPAQAPAVDLTRAPAQAPAVDLTRAPAQAPAVDLNRAPAQAPAVDLTRAPAQAPAVDLTRAPAQAPAVDLNRAPAQAPAVDLTRAPAQAPAVDLTRAPAQAPAADLTPAPARAPAPDHADTPSAHASVPDPVAAPGRAPAPVHPSAPDHADTAVPDRASAQVPVPGQAPPGSPTLKPMP